MDMKLALDNKDILANVEDDSHNKYSSYYDPSNDDDKLSTNTETPSEPWFDEHDLFSQSAAEREQEMIHEHDVLYDFTSDCAINESQLKEKEEDLYNDLIILENQEKKAKKSNDVDYNNLKNELVKLQESEALKNARISELSAENANLKKNICALFKTAKSEIEHKDSLLAELNRKLDNLLFRKNLQSCRHCRNERHGVSDAEKKSHFQSLDLRHEDGKSAKRRKLNDSPSSSYPGKESESARSVSQVLKDNDSRTITSEQFTPKSHSSVSKNRNTLQISNCGKDLETPETLKQSGNSRDSTETNNLFFNLLPPPLKQAFYDYEQSEIISLNKLKQAFINQHFNYDFNDQPPALESTPKRPRIQRFQRHFNQAVSENSELLQTPSSLQSRKPDSNYKPVANFSSKNTAKFGNYDCKVTKVMQKNIVTLFSYRKQKVPFLAKRKFELLKNNKK